MSARSGLGSGRVEFYRLLQKYALTPGLFRSDTRPEGSGEATPPAPLSPIGDK